MRGQKPLPPGYPPALLTIGDHIRRRRLAVGHQQKQLGRQLGVDSETIHNWEVGRTAPALGWVPKIIQFLGYDPLPEPKTIGQALTRHRQRHGISQRELANLLAVDQGTLGRWEREIRIPTGTWFAKVEAVLRARAAEEP